jgi:hypothetical protein
VAAAAAVARGGMGAPLRATVKEEASSGSIWGKRGVRVWG